MSVVQGDHEIYGPGFGFLGAPGVKSEPLHEKTPSRVMEAWTSEDPSLLQTKKIESELVESPFEIECSSFWQNEIHLPREFHTFEAAWDEEQFGVGVKNGEDRAGLFEKQSDDFIASDVLCSLIPSPPEEVPAQLQSSQTTEDLPMSIMEQWSHAESVISPSAAHDSRFPNSRLGEGVCNAPAPQERVMIQRETPESDAAKLVEKNRKSRERSFRTRARNAERMSEIENGIQRLESENTGIKSILDGSQPDLEGLLLAVLPTCVQQFENELARCDSPGVRRCSSYLVATIQSLSRDDGAPSAGVNSPQKKRRRTTYGGAPYHSMSGRCNSNILAPRADHYPASAGVESHGSYFSPSQGAAVWK